jgi:membrane protein DedA with SNARE-associated domain
MLDYIVHFVERVGHWGYFVIFFVVMVECQALLGLFMPGEKLGPGEWFPRRARGVRS